MLKPGKLTVSKPGSLWYGFSFRRLWMEMRTLDKLCAGLQDGPVHVLLEIPNYIAYTLLLPRKMYLRTRCMKIYLQGQGSTFVSP
jgi:hypothetical protein